MPPNGSLTSKASIFQIFYNEKSRRVLDSGFAPLDNSNSEHPEWFEFLPILRFLQSTTLVDEHWYGFLSPKFREKTGLSSAQLFSFLDQFPTGCDVFLATHGMDRIIWFDNVFHQGESWHKGLLQASQAFVDYARLNVEVRSLISHSYNAAFSNFVVAKPRYWRRWQLMAERLLLFSEEPGDLNGFVTAPTRHRSQDVPMLVFLQERLSALVLLDRSLMCARLPLTFSLRQYGARMQEMFIAMDVLKREYLGNRKDALWSAYRSLQDQLEYDRRSHLFKLRRR